VKSLSLWILIGYRYLSQKTETWKVALVNTSDNTTIEGYLFKASHGLPRQNTFLMTCRRDGVADVVISALFALHFRHGLKATVTAVQPLGRFGALDLDLSDRVRRFQEKPHGEGVLINGGFIFHPDVLNRNEGEQTYWGVSRCTHSNTMVSL